MGRMIVKQVNGKYAVYSTIVDDLIIVGATPEQIIAYYIKDSIEDITESVNDQINRNRLLDLDICLDSVRSKDRDKAAANLLSETYQEL